MEQVLYTTPFVSLRVRTGKETSWLGQVSTEYIFVKLSLF